MKSPRQFKKVNDNFFELYLIAKWHIERYKWNVVTKIDDAIAPHNYRSHSVSLHRWHKQVAATCTSSIQVKVNILLLLHLTISLGHNTFIEVGLAFFRTIPYHSKMKYSRSLRVESRQFIYNKKKKWNCTSYSYH